MRSQRPTGRRRLFLTAIALAENLCGRTAGGGENADGIPRLGRYLALKYVASVGTKHDGQSPPGDPLLLLSLMD